MKNQKTFKVEITADTYIDGAHTKKGEKLTVTGDQAYLLVANGKARLAADEEKKK